MLFLWLVHSIVDYRFCIRTQQPRNTHHRKYKTPIFLKLKKEMQIHTYIFHKNGPGRTSWGPPPEARPDPSSWSPTSGSPTWLVPHECAPDLCPQLVRQGPLRNVSVVGPRRTPAEAPVGGTLVGDQLGRQRTSLWYFSVVPLLWYFSAVLLLWHFWCGTSLWYSLLWYFCCGTYLWYFCCPGLACLA